MTSTTGGDRFAGSGPQPGSVLARWTFVVETEVLQSDIEADLCTRSGDDALLRQCETLMASHDRVPSDLGEQFVNSTFA